MPRCMSRPRVRDRADHQQEKEPADAHDVATDDRSSSREVRSRRRSYSASSCGSDQPHPRESIVGRVRNGRLLGQHGLVNVTRMALPGLEPGPDGSVDGCPAPSVDGSVEIPGGCGEGAEGAMAVDGRLRPRACSNVARALRDLLEHAKRSGLDSALRAAGVALEEDGADG